MNVCFYCKCSGGGTERATSNVANKLSAYHKVHIININGKGPYFSLNKEISCERIVEKNKIKHILKVAEYLRKNRIDYLVVVEAMGGLLAYPAAIIANCRIVIWEHANYFQNQGISYIQKVRQFELKHCDAYVLLTDKDKQNFEKYFKIRTKLRRIYNIAPPVSDNVYLSDSKTIISVGHIHKIKNYNVIPEIGKKVFKQHPDWCWKIYGTPNGEEYEKLKRKIEEYHLENNILLVGRSENMQEEYRKASMLVLTSLQEGLPMVLLEAKANKLPLISFDIQTGPDEIIQNGINGYLIQPYDVEEMANRICYLISNKKVRQNMSDQSILDMDKFHEASIVEQWNELLYN